MAAEVNLDTLRDIGAEEKGGVIFNLTRSVLVTGLDPTAAGGASTVIREALDAIGLAYGSLTAGPGGNNDLNLLLVRRTIKLTDLAAAEVTLGYEHVAETDLQNLRDPANGRRLFKLAPSLEQTETAVDYNGAPIWVSYTYPNGTSSYKDPDGNTLPYAVKYPGKKISQGGKIGVRVPIKRATLTGLLDCDDVNLVIDGILGMVNSVEWLGGKEGTWLCTEAVPLPWDLNASPNVYQWKFTFEYKDDGTFTPKTGDPVQLGWQPQAIFIDEDTGKPPPDWKDQVAYKFIDYYATQDFDDFFANVGVQHTSDEDF